MLFALKDAFKENMPELIATIKLSATRNGRQRTLHELSRMAGLEFVENLVGAAGVKVETTER